MRYIGTMPAYVDLPNEKISSCLRDYGLSPDPETCDRIRAYISLLLWWNRRIALTAVTDPVAILKFHFGESFYGMAAGIAGTGRLADVGTGAGFPGIPLHLANPRLRLRLIEPVLKKSVFLAEVKRELNLADVEIVRGRMEDIVPVAGGFDFIISRALGRKSEFLRFSRKNLAASGKVVLWVGADDALKLPANNALWSWSRPVPIPGSERRFIISASLAAPE